MPCSTCGSPLLVSHKYENLRCPNCRNIDVVDPESIQDEIKEAREWVSENQVVNLLKDYSKPHILLTLINELNSITHAFLDDVRTGLPVKEFSNLGYLVKVIYEHDGFGDEYFDEQDGLPEELEMLIDWVDMLIRAINQVEDGFQYITPLVVSPQDAQPFVGDYSFYDSEYRYCFQRCIRSLLGGSESTSQMGLFFRTAEEVRDFDRVSVDEIDSLADFTQTFFEIIVTMAFVLSSDETVGETYYTTLTDEVDVFDLREFLDRIDSQFPRRGLDHIQEGVLPVADEAAVDACGEKVFTDNWPDVRDSLIVSQENMEAHPFLFKLVRERVIKEPPGRPPITVDDPIVVYPRYYDLLVRFQLFPLLENGEASNGMDLLDAECNARGRQFERNLYKYLQNEGYECYYSAWFTKAEQREIDLIVANEADEELWFIECKFFLPELRMRTAEGIRKLNQKFDSKVFMQDTEHYSAESGEPFPQKVRIWLDQKPGDSFTSEVGPVDREIQDFPSSWADLDVRPFVISNVVPSYLEKQDVEFLTDMEFMEMIEGELDLYEAKD